MSDTTWTAAEVLEMAEQIRGHARDVFLSKGEHRPVSFLFTTKNPDTGAPEKSMAQVPVFGKFDGPEKDAYSGALRALAEKFGAVGIIFISEAWFVKSEVDKNQDMKKQADDQVDEWAGRLHEHPDRVETLFLICEHSRFGSIMWTAEITRPGGDPKAKPDLKEWVGETENFGKEEGKPGGGFRIQQGRFVHLLPQVD